MEFSKRYLLLTREVNLLMNIPMEDLDYPHPANALS